MEEIAVYGLLKYLKYSELKIFYHEVVGSLTFMSYIEH